MQTDNRKETRIKGGMPRNRRTKTITARKTLRKPATETVSLATRETETTKKGDQTKPERRLRLKTKDNTAQE